jgi:hypothetical protein
VRTCGATSPPYDPKRATISAQIHASSAASPQVNAPQPERPLPTDKGQGAGELAVRGTAAWFDAEPGPGRPIVGHVVRTRTMASRSAEVTHRPSSGEVIHCTGFCVSATVAAQEWTAIAADTAVARRSTVPRRLGSSTFKDDN